MRSIEDILEVKALFNLDDRELLELILDTKYAYIDAKNNNRFIEEYDEHLYKMYHKLIDLKLDTEALNVLYGLVEVSQQDNNHRYVSMYQCYVADRLRDLKRYKEALNVVQEALGTCLEYNITDSYLGHVYLTHTRIYNSMGNKKAMLEHQNKAISAHKLSIQRHIKRQEKKPIEDNEKLMLLCNRCLSNGLCDIDL